MAKRAPKFDERYNRDKYNEEVQYTFERGVDSPVLSYTDEFNGEEMHYSYWSNDDGEWCYVYHDESGNYETSVPLYECAEIGLRVDTPKKAKAKKVKPAKPVKLPKSAKMWVLSFEDGASVGIFSMPHGGVGNGPRWFFARGKYVGAGRGQYFQAIEGSVRMLDYASGEALAEYDRICAIDAAFWRAKENERLEAEEAARIEAEADEVDDEGEASAEPVEPTQAELEAAGQLRLF